MKYKLPPGVTKTYLSRSMTRALSLHGPIGDPFGGPAYGERNDPISAALSVTAMAGSYAAAGSFAAMTLAQGMIFAGGALSLAGNVTGNKSLMKIGAVVGLIGGIGGVMEIGSFNEQVFTDVAQSSGAVPSTGAEALGQTPTTSTGPVDVNASLSTDVATPNIQPGQSYAGSQIPQPNVNAAPANLNATPQALTTEPGTFSKIVDFANRNPGGALLAAQAVGSLATPVANVLTGADDAQIDQLKADARYRLALAEKAQMDLEEEQRKRDQLRQNQTLATQAFSVNPSGVTINTPGLINARRTA